MKTNFRFTALVWILATSALIFSCKKETSVTDLTPEQQGREEQAAVASTEAETESELVFDDVFNTVLGVNAEVGLGGTGIFEMQDGLKEPEKKCYTVVFTHLTAGEPFPLRVVIDFGTGCTGKDGHTRSGKIITEYSGHLMIAGKSATTTFENYKIDSISVEGTHKITNTSTVGNRQFTVEVTNARLTKPNGNYSKWNSHRVITQIEGVPTKRPADDVFSISGSASGEIKRDTINANWTSDITEPLIKKFTCRRFSKGIVKTTRTNSSNSTLTSILNYGNGHCDKQATLTVNGKEHQIKLH